MSTVEPVTFPWINIPLYAQPGQKHAFANREQPLARLYKALIAAGNAVRKGQSGIRQKYVVLGYKGVGKSALILQALGMLRDELGVAEGQHLALPPGLPEPLDRERWLILMASGKHVPSVDAIADSLQRSILSVLDDVVEDAEQAVPNVLHLPFHHRLFRRRESRLFGEVRSALLTLSSTIDYARFFLGSTQSDKLERTLKIDSSYDAEANLDAQLKSQGKEPRTVEAKAALKLAAAYVRKFGMMAGMSVERKRIIDAEWVVDALNAFFAATQRAGVPTILVLDDFDEFASNAGPSHLERAKVLEDVLGPFSRLSPTFLVIGLRSEYMHEDLNRQYQLVTVPPMTREAASRSITAWGRVQEPELTAEQASSLLALADRFLAPFDQGKPIVNPFRFLQLIYWVASNGEAASSSAHALLLDYLESNFSYDVKRIAESIAFGMPEADIYPCASASALAPDLYDLSDRDRSTLEQFGLLRPAMAGDPSNKHIVLDPLFAYLRALAVPKLTIAEVFLPDSCPRLP